MGTELLTSHSSAVAAARLSSYRSLQDNGKVINYVIDDSLTLKAYDPINYNAYFSFINFTNLQLL